MQPKGFAQQSSGPAAMDSIPDFAGRDHAQAGIGSVAQQPPVCNETAVHDSLAFLPNAAEVPSFFDSRSSPETQFSWPSRCHGWGEIIQASAACGRLAAGFGEL